MARNGDRGWVARMSGGGRSMADHRRHGEGSGAPHLLAAAILLLSDGLGTGIGFAGRRGGGCGGEEARRLVDAGPTFMVVSD